MANVADVLAGILAGRGKGKGGGGHGRKGALALRPFRQVSTCADPVGTVWAAAARVAQEVDVWSPGYRDAVHAAAYDAGVATNTCRTQAQAALTAFRAALPLG
jgi:hypothetical protein